MTNELALRSLNIPDFHKFAVGFDSMFDDLMRLRDHGNNYPPFNIIKYSEDKFAIELAVAGFNDGDIDIQVDKNQLTVKGEQAVNLDNPIEYLHRGISSRNFIRNWTLADYVEVQGAEVINGILIINLERIVPESDKPKKISVNFNK